MVEGVMLDNTLFPKLPSVYIDALYLVINMIHDYMPGSRDRIKLHWLLQIQNISGLYGNNPDSKVLGANMGPIWGRQDSGGPHAGPMNFAIWEGHRKYRIIIHHQASQLFNLVSDVHCNTVL